MMKKTLKDKKDRILAAAEKIFIEKGFAGASMSVLAREASIPVGLIYHYFASKEELWKQVKIEIVQRHLLQTEGDASLSGDLRSILHKIISSRCHLYRQSPEIVRLMCWQRLEENRQDLEGGTSFSHTNWVQAFDSLQRRQLMRQDYDPALVALLLSNAITYALLDHQMFFEKSPEKEQAYIQMTLDFFERALRP